ncbi:hypothetical protein ZIOFF_063561 [Zingiber officinale]|uniref:GTP cyclohydrolase 1 n=1 Tax=Zingiber officinale TaxID=94328 RepID=A0A8J5F6Q8_ZINOF|nr:hypothetical protein ZIOFF_063561 [Zingiber officinale]
MKRRGYKQNVKDIVQDALFPESGLNLGIGHGGGAGGLVVVRDINLFSYCESCLLPFSIKCHVGYIPSGGRVVGLSKLSRTADVFARRLQEPKRLASEICAALHSSIKPAGVAVALQCRHMKLPEDHSSDIDSTHSTVSVSSRSGDFKEAKSSLWDDFSFLLRLRGVVIEREDTDNSHVYPWCPLRSPELPQSNGHCVRNTKNGKNNYNKLRKQKLPSAFARTRRIEADARINHKSHRAMTSPAAAAIPPAKTLLLFSLTSTEQNPELVATLSGLQPS